MAGSQLNKRFLTEAICVLPLYLVDEYENILISFGYIFCIFIHVMCSPHIYIYSFELLLSNIVKVNNSNLLAPSNSCKQLEKDKK